MLLLVLVCISTTGILEMSRRNYVGVFRMTAEQSLKLRQILFVIGAI